MKAIVFSKKHPPSKLILQEVDKPTPKDDEVLVKLAFTSVNAADYRSMKMGMIPKRKIFGAAIAGTVEVAGKQVREFNPGDKVMADLADSGFGGFAEYVAAPAKLFIHKPEQVPFDVAAAIPLAATTALQGLNKGDIQPGQQVLIVGSGGGVGTFAVQLAKNFEAEVTGVCSTRNVEQTLALGASHVIDYTQEDFTKRLERYDLILAINGNYPLLGCKRCLKPHGVYVMVGGSLGQIFKSMLFGWLLSMGSKKIRTLAAKPTQEDLEVVAKLVAEGKVQPVIEKRYQLADTAEAVQYMAEGHARGKVIIEIENKIN